ncbi:MAG TPA: CBS domain-containing protein [Solirubrobacterales bacterium]|nr:CBS domain-containing protein [Solirubrobacterales bacterium]
MPDSIVKSTLREVEPLDADEPIGPAARRVIAAGLPALPAVERDGRFAGIFGEREFMAALFPGYVGELASAAMVSRSVDETIERRSHCATEPVRRWLTTDHVVVEDTYSDTQLAEIFLHHRVLVVPIASGGRIHAVLTRSDFFAELVSRFGSVAEDLGGSETGT